MWVGDTCSGRPTASRQLTNFLCSQPISSHGWLEQCLQYKNLQKLAFNVKNERGLNLWDFRNILEFLAPAQVSGSQSLETGNETPNSGIYYFTRKLSSAERMLDLTAYMLESHIRILEPTSQSLESTT